MIHIYDCSKKEVAEKWSNMLYAYWVQLAVELIKFIGTLVDIVFRIHKI